MKKFKFEITETLQKTLFIEADDENEAYEKISNMYRCGEIVLEAEDFIEKEINLLN